MNNQQKQQYFQQLGQKLLGNLLNVSLQDFAKFVSTKLNVSEKKMNEVLSDYLMVVQKTNLLPSKKAHLSYQERKKNLKLLIPQAYAQKTVHECTNSQTKYEDEQQRRVEEKKSNKFIESQQDKEEYVAKKTANSL